MTFWGKTFPISTASMLLLGACGETVPAPAQAAETTAELPALAPANWADVEADLVGRDGAAIGKVMVVETPGDGVLMRMQVGGLTPGWHGAHLHQVGECSDYRAGFKASGGHVDPDDRAHGLMNADGPERADLPNIYAGADGRATAEIFVRGLSLNAHGAADAHPLLNEDGFAVVVHANADDHMTQPIGGAGERVACAAIGGK